MSLTHERADRPKPRGNWRGLFAVPLVALWVVPVALFVVLVPVSQSQESSALIARTPGSIIVGSRLDASRQTVDIAIRDGLSAGVRSALSGLVTSVSVAQGAEIANGGTLVSVDGVPVRAYQEAAPLYRDLAMGDHGSDVLQLGQYLSSLGLMPASAVSTTYGRPLANGVSAFEKQAGVKPDGHFSASLVAWVPTGATKAGLVKVTTGQTVASGDILVESSAAPSAVKFTVTGESSKAPNAPVGQALRLTAGAAHVDIQSLALTAAERTAVLDLLTAAAASGSVTASTASGSTTFSGAILAVASPQHIGSVPSSAVYVTPGGAACIFVVSGAATHAVVLAAPQLINGELGSVAVPNDLIGKRVVRDPTALPAKTAETCR